MKWQAHPYPLLHHFFTFLRNRIEPIIQFLNFCWWPDHIRHVKKVLIQVQFHKPQVQIKLQKIFFVNITLSNPRFSVTSFSLKPSCLNINCYLISFYATWKNSMAFKMVILEFFHFLFTANNLNYSSPIS